MDDEFRRMATTHMEGIRPISEQMKEVVAPVVQRLDRIIELLERIDSAPK